MNASKETARKARKEFAIVQAQILNVPTRSIQFITDFIDAAERKLPTEEAYKRDRQRKKPVVA